LLCRVAEAIGEMPELVPVLSKEEIQGAIAAVAKRISVDFRNRDVVMVGVLKGAFLFLADLVREMSIPVTVDFVRVSSYGAGTETSGSITLSKEVEVDINGRHVIIVEDIVDSGLTLAHLIRHFEDRGAASVKVCSVVDKRERRQVDVTVDYACHTVERGFLVGYGLDYDEAYRDLPEIYHLKFSAGEGSL
jgi:hypoxanthine phosphoribosyltransferase